MLDTQIQKLVEQQQAVGKHLQKLAILQKRLGYQRINMHIGILTRQWMALDGQIKQLCAIEVDGQRMRAGIENQLAELFA